MEQRRLRLGDILDDYCPRERRITNHAVVAMIEDEVKQTRCTTCDADHEYREAKVPLSRKRKRDGPAMPEVAGGSADESSVDVAAILPDADDQQLAGDPAFNAAPEPALADEDLTEDEPEATEDDGPVHRRLIRATLPRPEGQAPERKPTDFTMRQQGGRFDQQRGGQGQGQGQRPRGGRPARHAQTPSGQPTRFGGPRQGGGQGNAQGQRPGNRFGDASGQRGGRPPGPPRGERPGGGQGRKRGR